MRVIVFLLAVATGTAGWAQPLTGLNFNDWYDPQSTLQAHGRVVRSEAQVRVWLKWTNTGGAFTIQQYEVAAERRDSYTQRQGVPVPFDSTQWITQGETRYASLVFDKPEKPWLLVMRFKNKGTQKSWTFFYPIEASYPVDGWLEDEKGAWVSDRFLTVGKTYTLKNDLNKPVAVSYYQAPFKPAYPPFAEQGKSDQFLFYDSLFFLQPGDLFKPFQEGLYLFQTDTTAATGFSYLVRNRSYPKYTTIQGLKEPMIFVTTSEEYSQIEAAGEEKAKFDKVVLDFTRDKERAKIFMRNYFRRVELANLYFTSYKEGWKTDRGMVYLIFGPPDEVSRNGGNEVWYYRASSARYTFVKVGSVYDANNFVLLRDNRFAEDWYSTIDLWRKSRF
ncbi:MAG: GWxTD domain-containing protein [Cyclobacteriaceae bacterium]|jgi:GWxTD domain-containing protein|nr:GWxTD domain-containing protein [Cyclobacteriaceae bacterium]